MAIKDITGLRFGRLVAIEPTEKRDYNGMVYWRCKCDCGKETIVSKKALRHEGTKSCGCLKKESNRKHAFKMGNANRKHFGCIYCGSDKHYAKGCCAKCYKRMRRGKLDFVR